MSVRVHKIVSKAEMNDGGGTRVVKTEIHPEDNWVLVDGALDVTLVERFRAQHQACDYAVTDWKPDDAIRIRIKRSGDEIEIFMDREHGGAWWPMFQNPTMKVKFDYPLAEDRKIRIEVSGGDLKEPVQVGTVNLLPPAKSSLTE